MFTDMAGYTALGQRNESLSLAMAEEQRKLTRPVLARHGGREVKTMGDSFLVEFQSALDAVRCAYEIQRITREFNISLPQERRIHIRIGIHLGDVVESGGDISGDAVNIASRIQPLADVGGICLTRQVFDQVQNKLELPLVSMGPRSLKNVLAPLEVFRVVLPWEEQQARMGALDSRRIAILPFVNMSPDPNDSYFAEGVTEEVISTVSTVSGLSVISRTSVMGYKGTAKKVKEIGKELEVGSVLEGSFRKSGNRVRITTQLIDVNTDAHVWTQSYDRDLDDVFAVQSDIAKQVADALRVRILTAEMERISKRPTENSKAYALYLRGRYHWNKRGIDDTKRAAEYFEQAVKEDPNFALGYVGLADSYELLFINWKIDPAANHEKAKANLTKALELDPLLAEAHTTMGLWLTDDYRLREAKREFQKAIELKPGYATAHQWYSSLLSAEQRWDEAQEHIEKAVELDPFSLVINSNNASMLAQRGDYAKAVELYKKAVELDPGFGSTHFDLAMNYGRLKMYDEMSSEAELGVELLRAHFPRVRTAADILIAYERGDKGTIERLLPELEEDRTAALFFIMLIANLNFYLGRVDKGFEYLERAYSVKEPGMVQLKNDEDLNEFHSDPRYLDLLKRLELD
jgi:adenylate cyclase